MGKGQMSGAILEVILVVLKWLRFDLLNFSIQFDSHESRVTDPSVDVEILVDVTGHGAVCRTSKLSQMPLLPPQ
jgi:hypothetical protein